MPEKNFSMTNDSMLLKESFTKSMTNGKVVVPTFNPDKYTVTAKGQLITKQQQQTSYTTEKEK